MDSNNTSLPQNCYLSNRLILVMLTLWGDLCGLEKHKISVQAPIYCLNPSSWVHVVF